MAKHTESMPSMDTEACSEEDQLLAEASEGGCLRKKGTKLAVFSLAGLFVVAAFTYVVAPSAIVSSSEEPRHGKRRELIHSEQVNVPSHQVSDPGTTKVDPTRDAEWGRLISLFDNTGAAAASATDALTTISPTQAWTWTSTQTTSTVTETPPWDPPQTSPNLYCWEYVLSDTEVSLAKAQLLYHASIFECNKFDVFSLTKELLGDGPDGEVYTTIVPGPGAVVKQISRDGAPPTRVIVNAPLFSRIWDQVNKLERFFDADWIVKADADAVFLPERLRPHLAWKNINRDALVWFKNCQATSWSTLQGPLEVFSHGAIDSFFKNKWKCSMDESTNGAEDWFMAHCLEAQGIQGTVDTELLNDNYCHNDIQVCDCSWGDRSAYHPCKDVPSYLNCRNIALGTR